MRKFKEPLPLGGVPFFADDFLMLQAELMKASLYMYSSLSSEVILSGCEVTITEVGTNDFRIVNISSGYVMMRDKDNGYKPEIYYVEGQSFSPTVSKIWLIPAADTFESRILKTGTTADVVVNKRAQLITDPANKPALNDPQIVYDPLPSVRLTDLLFRHSKRIGEIIPLGLIAPSRMNPLLGPGDIPLFLQTELSPTQQIGFGKYYYNGFAICNGNNNTPDLKRRFLTGLDPYHKDYNTVGKIGGAAEVYLYKEYLPPHTHSGHTNNDGAHAHAVPFAFNAAGDGLFGYESSNNDSKGTYPTQTGGEHRHAFTTNDGDGLNSQPHENMPPFYTVLYIQRIF